MATLRVRVIPGRCAEALAHRLRERDSTGLLAVSVGDHPATVALVVGVEAGHAAGRAAAGQAADIVAADLQAADVVLDGSQPLAAQADQLWSERLAPFARAMAGQGTRKPGPAVLREHDPRFPAAASRMLGRLRDGLTASGLDDGRWTYDHIGSTSVPGLRAKPFIDLQIGAATLPLEGSPVDDVLAAGGFQPEKGARPDSPGVYRDGIKDPDLAPAEAYRKRLYSRPDPALRSILHVRLLGSPWWSYTVRFRDWLRASPSGRSAYEQMKQGAADAHAHAADFDDYTRAKGAFFDQVQAAYEQATTRDGKA